MSRRTLAGILAVPLLIALWVAAVLTPLPYVTYTPGITVNVLGQAADGGIIEVTGAESFRTDGELRMTTVYVTQPEGRVNLFEALGAWLSPERAVYPRDSVYEPDATRESNRMQSAVQMVSSQDAAIAVALKELDYEVAEAVEVLNVQDGMPADGQLFLRDVILEVAGTEIATPQDVVDAVAAEARPDEPIEFLVSRAGQEERVEITPVEMPVEGGQPGETALRVGIVPGMGFTFPIDVRVRISEQIGGPSAGLVFSLAVYDLLTEGSLTGEGSVAGSGTVDAEGAVGPIGGIQQKIAAAENDGSDLFLVPADNCADALTAAREDMRLVKVTSVREAIESIETWAADPDAALPACEEAAR